MEPQDLLLNLQKIIPSILTESPVLFAYLYGSAAEGKTTEYSDVDIGLFIDPKHNEVMHPYDRLVLETDIALELERNTKLPEVDIRILNDAPLLLRGRGIQRGYLLYSADEDFRIDYETITLKEYLDFLPIANHIEHSYFDRRLKALSISQASVK